MKLLLLRHGESVDDIENRYGGWGDFPLTEKGKQQVKDSLARIKELNTEFETVFTSPLSRATQVAEMISSELGIELKVYEYLKEHNKNGLLSGMNRDEAKEKYPDEFKKLETGEIVDGAEKWEDFLLRSKKGFDHLFDTNVDKNIIAVTHGGQVRAFFLNYFEQKLNKVDDLAFAFIDWTKPTGKPVIISSYGIELV